MAQLESPDTLSHLCIDCSVLDPLSSINNVVICSVLPLKPLCYQRRGRQSALQGMSRLSMIIISWVTLAFSPPSHRSALCLRPWLCLSGKPADKVPPAPSPSAPAYETPPTPVPWQPFIRLPALHQRANMLIASSTWGGWVKWSSLCTCLQILLK